MPPLAVTDINMLQDQSDFLFDSLWLILRTFVCPIGLAWFLHYVWVFWFLICSGFSSQDS